MENGICVLPLPLYFVPCLPWFLFGSMRITVFYDGSSVVRGSRERPHYSATGQDVVILKEERGSRG